MTGTSITTTWPELFQRSSEIWPPFRNCIVIHEPFAHETFRRLDNNELYGLPTQLGSIVSVSTLYFFFCSVFANSVQGTWVTTNLRQNFHYRCWASQTSPACTARIFPSRDVYRSLSNNEFFGKVPPELKNLKELQTLYVLLWTKFLMLLRELAQNELFGNISESILLLSKLEVLYVNPETRLTYNKGPYWKQFFWNSTRHAQQIEEAQ